MVEFKQRETHAHERAQKAKLDSLEIPQREKKLQLEIDTQRKVRMI